MERVELLTVEDAFQFSKNPDGIGLLVLHPAFAWLDEGWQHRTEAVLVVRPDGNAIEATAVIESSHLNIRDPNVPVGRRWLIRVSLTDRTKAEVPAGSKILVPPVLRAALHARRSSGDGPFYYRWDIL